MVCEACVRGCEEGGDKGAGVVQAIKMSDLFGGLEGENGVREGGLAPVLQGLHTREGVPGGVYLDGGVVGEVVGKLLGSRKSWGVEVAVAPVGVDIARCADEDGHYEA